MRRERCSVRLRRTAVLHIYTGLLKTSAANSEGKRAPLSESVLDGQHCKAQRLLRWGTYRAIKVQVRGGWMEPGQTALAHTSVEQDATSISAISSTLDYEKQMHKEASSLLEVRWRWQQHIKRVSPAKL